MNSRHSELVFGIEIPIRCLQHFLNNVEMIVFCSSMQQVVLSMPSGFNWRRKFLHEVLQFRTQVCRVAAIVFYQIFKSMVDRKLAINRKKCIFSVFLYLIMPELSVIIHWKHVIVGSCGTFADKENPIRIADLRFCKIKLFAIKRHCFNLRSMHGNHLPVECFQRQSSKFFHDTNHSFRLYSSHLIFAL